MDAGITFKSWAHITLNFMHKTDDYELRMKNMKYFPDGLSFNIRHWFILEPSLKSYVVKGFQNP